MALFFPPEQVPDGDVADDDPPLGQFICKRSCCDVSLFADTGYHPITFALKNARTMATHLSRFGAAGGAIARHQFDHG